MCDYLLIFNIGISPLFVNFDINGT